MKSVCAALAAAIVALGTAGSQPAAADAPRADTIYEGGPIVTMDPNTEGAEAVAVAGGRILAVGAAADVERLAGPATRRVDLHGRTLLPGLIDAHGHITMLAAVARYADLQPPPAGHVSSVADVQQALAAQRDRTAAEGGWIVGFGYDDSLLAEQRHPTRHDLDAVSADRPVLILHVSGHLAAANSRALELMGIGPDTPDPEGGVIRREADGRQPDGVLEEHAMFLAVSKLPRPDEAQRLADLDEAQRVYAGYGITTAQDGATQAADLALLRDAAAQRRLIIDVVAYPTWLNDGLIGDAASTRTYDHRLRVGGVKLVLDGSPQGKTAWLSQPYYKPPPGKDADYRGYPALSDAEVNRRVLDYYGRGWQVLAHCNGDAAAQQFIDAVAAAEAAYPGRDQRPVMIHAQTVRDDQLDRMAKLGMIPSFFVTHTFYWGDWHRESVLGPARAYRISPARSAADRGIRFTIHNDAPIVPPDIMRLMWSAVNRRSRSGDIIGPLQRVSARRALQSVTIDAARQYFEENEKGSITPGKGADLVILDRNPLTVPPETIKDIRVMETVKDGRTIFTRPAESATGS
ncbi:MAG: amidohydrolase family protein [Alphaproteobacteria bacterium]|nr:amidohydrolase family protein [Alphaproteobacteria bacterium]